MPWFRIEFMVEADSLDDFSGEDEDRIGAALPGKNAYLVAIEESPAITDALKRQWRRLKGS
jgi:hypothetical protein